MNSFHTSNKSALFILFFSFAILGMLSCEKKEAKVFYPELAIPNFTIYKAEDSTVFTNKDLSKEGLLLLKYFSPSCNGCQLEAQVLNSLKDSLSNIKTVWMTGSWAMLDSVQEFRKRYGVDELNLIAIGKEDNDLFLRTFKLKTVPFSLVYKDNQLLAEYSGAVDLRELIAINKGTYVGEPMDSLLARKKALVAE